MYGVAGKKFQRQYKNRISDYKTWKEKSHAQEWLIYPENMSQSLSIDEVALSSGELYTVITSKKAKGKKGCLVAIIKETRAETKRKRNHSRHGRFHETHCQEMLLQCQTDH